MMRKIILVLSVWALVPAVYVAVAHADDDAVLGESRGVAQRMSCDDINSEIKKLSGMDELSDADAARLGTLKSDYRSKCVKTSGRRSRGQAKIIVNNEVPAQDVAVADVAVVSDGDVPTTCDTPDANGCCPGETYKDLGDLGFNCCTENDEHCFPPIKADVAKLCDDGAAPNADGCCAGETYTDLGDLGWNCCMPDGVTCFPPMK